MMNIQVSETKEIETNLLEHQLNNSGDINQMVRSSISILNYHIIGATSYRRMQKVVSIATTKDVDTAMLFSKSTLIKDTI